MKYVQPYGIADEDAPYINGDPSIARMGSIPPAAAFEHPMRELVSVISNSLFTPVDTDLEQVAKSVRSQRMNYAEDTGSANVLSVAFDPPFTTYTIGLPIRVKVRNTNTGVASIDAGAGRVAIKKPTGAEVAAGDLPAGGLVELVYDGTSFVMINFGGAGGGPGSVFLVKIPYTVDVGTPNVIVANFSPPLVPADIVQGLIVMVKAGVGNTNTGPTTININGTGAKPVYALGGTPEIPFLVSDIIAGDIMILTYDGTRFWIVPNPIISTSVTMNVANNTDIANVFKAIARKRIQPAVTLTIKMATGIYGIIDTYHVDSDRIVLEGTMLAANPVSANFAKTGSAPAQRASDSANNISMLRGRYGSEVRFDNTLVNRGAVQHFGPGRITYKNLLITGANALHPSWNSWIVPTTAVGGTQILLDGCAIWGSGGYGISINTDARAWLYNTWITGGLYHGVHAFNGAAIWMEGGGVFGCSQSGVASAQSGWFQLRQNVSIQCNGSVGIDMTNGCNVWAVYNCTSTQNAVWDLYLSNLSSAVVATSSGAVIGTASPAAGSTGNNFSVHATA
jgi:Right handed beta helix region